MNSLSYLSRQFDALVASSSSLSSSSSRSSQNSSQSSSSISSSSSSSSVNRSPSISARFRRVKSPSSSIAPQPPISQQAPAVNPTTPAPSSSSVNSNMNATSPLKRPKSYSDPLSRLVFIRLLLFSWALLQTAWKSVTIRARHMTPEPETEPDTEVEVVQVDEIADTDEKDAEEILTKLKNGSLPPHLHQEQLPFPSSLNTISHLPHSPAFILSHADIRKSTPPTQTPTPPPIPQPSRSTPFHLPKTLVLDLDETLIHSTSRPLYSHSHSSSNLLGLKGFRRNSLGASHTVEVVLGGKSTTYHVYKRPFVDYFLRKVSTWYTLVIFTASMQEYADPVIDWLDGGRGILDRRHFRESCTQLPNGSYTKDLTIIESDLSRVCLVDNSPISYNINEANGIPIEGWTHDPHDEALLELLPVLDSLRFTGDVRRVLGIRGFS